MTALQKSDAQTGRERPATKLIDWSRPVRSIENPGLIGIVLPDDHIVGRKRVAMLHRATVGTPVLEGKGAAEYTVYRYDEYGRCHTHKLCSPFDLENFER